MRTSEIIGRLRGLLVLALCGTAVFLTCAVPAPRAAANAFVQMDFNIPAPGRLRDTVFLEVFDVDRPLTSNNFLQYVNGGHYDNSLMHRLARPNNVPFVLQGGGFHPKYRVEPPPQNVSLDRTETVDLDDNPATPLPTVPNEFSNTPLRSNQLGTLAMARPPGQPNGATSQFFFNLKDNGGTPPNGLDFQDGGFAVFAKVAGDGMTLINAYGAPLPSGLITFNLNEDVNGDGHPDNIPGDPFAEVPVLVGQSGFIPLILEKAKRINYYGAGPGVDLVGGDLTASGRDAFIDTGAVINGTDPLQIGVGRTLGVRENTLLQRTLVNRGTFAPGLQIGAIAINNYQQFSTGTLEIELAGTTAGTQHDQVLVGALAFLGGKIDVSLAGGFTPKHGDSFTVLRADSAAIIGDFVSGTLPLLSGGLVWDYNRSPNAITLSVVRADFNQNGIVDAADYDLWRKAFNQTGTNLAADANGDGRVDSADYVIWRSNLGNIAGTQPPGAGSLASATVPEPATASILMAAAAWLVSLRRVSRLRASRKAGI